MKIDVSSKTELKGYFQKIWAHVTQNDLYATKYIDLGVKVIRVLCYTPEVIPAIERQLTYVLRDSADHFDETIVVWKEKDVDSCAKSLDERLDPKKNLKLRIEMLYAKNRYPSVEIMDNHFSPIRPVILFNNTMIEAYDTENHIAYYAVDNFDPEEFIKRGHIFVRLLNGLIKTPTVNLVHGAIFGFNNNGILLCARGQRGKSTLTVHAMMHGFEYVSDDYQILEHGLDGTIYSYPIYSIITLSPQMYNELYDDLKGKFVSNNARKDKYVINISPYHDQFRSHYPVRVCIFPEIVSDKDPSIVKCSVLDKGRAIVQMIHSTVMQMHDLNDKGAIKKLFDMVKGLSFYKLNLCRDIPRNTEYLRQFLQTLNFNEKDTQKLDEIMVDITFDRANILNTESYTFYSMNKLATSVYEALLAGVDKAVIRSELSGISGKNKNILEEFDLFVDVVEQKRFLNQRTQRGEFKLNFEFAEESNFKISLLEFATDEIIELVNLKKGK